MKGLFRRSWDRENAKFVRPGKPPEGGGVRTNTLPPAEMARGRIRFGRAVEAHLAGLQGRGYSPATIRCLTNIASAFLRLSGVMKRTPLVEVTPKIAERAMAKLVSRYGPGTAWRYATGWIQLFRAFTAAGYLLENPFAKVDGPRRPKTASLPTLSREEVERLLKTPNLRLPSGVRNRAILEVFYSTGIRLSECRNLAVRDLDFAGGTLLVREGKGGKARVVPLGSEAVRWIRRYQTEVRPRWAGTSEALFVGQHRKSISNLWIERIVSRLGRKAGIGKPVTPHTLRRTCATHLLSGGASAWAVRGILGHSDLRTLGRYVHLHAGEIQEMHAKTHPRA